MPRRSSSPSPLGLLAVFLIGAVGVGLLTQRGRDSRDPRPGPSEDLGSSVDATSGFAGPAPSTRRPPSHPPPLRASASDICRNVAYLCTEVEAAGRTTLRRWLDFDGTLIVHVPLPPDEDRSVATRLQRAASAGIRAWNGRPFPILVDERGDREAHIEVSWSQALGGSQLGRTETSWTPGAGLRVRALHLATRRPFRLSLPLDPGQVRLTAAHEMGHALGLPHSDESRDVMYPTNTSSSLTARDYRTLEALYALQDGLEIVR